MIKINTLKTFILVFLSTSLLSQEQELDNEFLESLPEDVKADVLERIESKEELEKPVYRRASTAIDKDKEEFSRFEDGTKLFGSDFF